MPRIDTDPEALRRVATGIEHTGEEIKAALIMVRKALDLAYWHDDARRQFDQTWTEMTNVANRFQRQVAPSTTHLRRKAAELQRYLGR